METLLLNTGELLEGGVQQGKSQAMSASGMGAAPAPDAPDAPKGLEGLEGLEAEADAPDAPDAQEGLEGLEAIPSCVHQAGHDILAVRRR